MIKICCCYGYELWNFNCFMRCCQVSLTCCPFFVLFTFTVISQPPNYKIHPPVESWSTAPYHNSFTMNDHHVINVDQDVWTSLMTWRHVVGNLVKNVYKTFIKDFKYRIIQKKKTKELLNYDNFIINKTCYKLPFVANTNDRFYNYIIAVSFYKLILNLYFNNL